MRTSRSTLNAKLDRANTLTAIVSIYREGRDVEELEAKVKTVKLKAPSAGRYVAKITAKAAGKTAKASAAVRVK